MDSIDSMGSPPSYVRALGVFDGQGDVGSVHHPGSCRYDGERQEYQIAASGANIWGARDAFHMAWRRMAGDFIVTARAAFVGAGVDPHRKLGWMVRTSLEADSAHASAMVHGDGLTSLQYRRAAGAATEELRSPCSGADVIQIERRGSSFIMSVAHHGELFVVTQLDDLDLGDAVFVGLAVCSHNEGVVEQATFQNVRVVVPAAAGFNRQSDPFASLLELVEVESGRRQIIHHAPTVFEAPNWMPDGRALIYNSGGRLYRFDLATRASELIDTDPVTRNNNDHVISFDGTMLGISSSTADENYSIVWTVPIQGGTPKRITGAGYSYLHGWSPDGKYLVYTALRNGDFDIYRISATGESTEETQLTTVIGLDDGPEYSPDGAYIYFNSVRSGVMQIWRMRPDGSEPERVTNDSYNNWFPHLSPDGRWIVFISYDEPINPSDHPAAKRCYLRMMPAAGGEPRVLAYLYGGQGTINVPSWSPDGTRLAFVSNTVTL